MKENIWASGEGGTCARHLQIIALESLLTINLVDIDFGASLPASATQS